MSIKTVFRDSRIPLISNGYRLARAPYAYWLLYRRRAAHAVYLGLMERQREEAVVLSVQQLLRQIEGDIAEFGVRTGIYARIECRELGAWQARRKLYLFDSWEGYGEPTADDRSSWEVRAGRFVGQPNDQPSPQALHRQLGKVYDPALIVMCKGFFADTLPRLDANTRFGMIVMDADLYSSSCEVFNNIFGRRLVSEGALILFNSWNGNRAAPDAAVRRAWSEAVNDYAISFSEAGFWGWSGRKVIVHSYRSAV